MTDQPSGRRTILGNNGLPQLQRQESTAAAGDRVNIAPTDYQQQSRSLLRHQISFMNGNVDVHRPEIQFNNPPFLIGNGGRQEEEENRLRSQGGAIRRYRNTAAAPLMAVASSHYAGEPGPSFTRRPALGIAAAAGSSTFAGQLMIMGRGSVSDSVGLFPRVFTPATASCIAHANNNYMGIPTNPFYGTPTLQGLNAAADLPPAFTINYPPTFRPQTLINPTHLTSPTHGTQGNHTSANDGNQVINSSIRKTKRRAGRPCKDSSSPNPLPTRQKKDKAIQMKVRSIRVGQWVIIGESGWIDLLAKCYFGKRSFIWECLFYDTKRKKRMCIDWKFVKNIKINSPPEGNEILSVEVSQPPKFSQETNVTVKKCATWGNCEDFTSGQALSCMIHELEFEPGQLCDDFKKSLIEHKDLRKLVKRSLFLTHASNSSDKPGQHDRILDQAHLPPTQSPPQQFRSIITSSSRPSGISEVAGADEEVLSAYDPLQIQQNNLAANNSNIDVDVDQRNVQTGESIEWHSFHKDVGDGLSAAFDSDSE